MVGIQVDFKNNSSLLKNSGYSVKEEEELYDRLLEDVIQNPRWYLDNMLFMKEFRVRWADYKKQNITKPYRFVAKPKAL